MNTEFKLRRAETKKDGLVELIDQTTIDKVKADISRNIGVDVSDIPVSITNPGDTDFDFLDLLPRVRDVLLQNDQRPRLQEIMKIFHKNYDEGMKQLHALADELHITPLGALKGFVYTIGYKKILYPSIQKSQAQALATNYAAKEKISHSFTTDTQAIAFLERLAEKYLYHEIAHVIYQKFPESVKMQWIQIVLGNPQIQQRVREVQSGNVNTSIMYIQTIADEAFADIFVAIASKDAHSNRLGNFPHERAQAESILTDLGFKIIKK